MSKPVLAILRAAIALAIGTLLVLHPESATKTIVILIGLLFLLIGIVSAVYNVKAMHRPDASNGTPPAAQFPVTSIGCIILGLVLALLPDTFLTISMFILGAFLVLAGAFQMVNFRICSRTVRTPPACYIVSALVMAAGLFIFVNPIESASLPMIVLGTSFIAYGAMEVVLSVESTMAGRRIKKAEKEAAAAEQAAAPKVEKLEEKQEESRREYITFADDSSQSED